VSSALEEATLMFRSISASRIQRLIRLFALAVLLCHIATPAGAQTSTSIEGIVVDPLGAAVAGATVTLILDGLDAGHTSSDSAGRFAFGNLQSGRYQLRASAAGFEPELTPPVFVGTSGRSAVEIALHIGLRQDVVVSAAATEMVQSQTGAQVSVIDGETLESLGKVDVLEALRIAPSVQVAQTGARGGLTSLFIRGGNSNFNKVLLDGVSANDVGGAVDLGQIATTGIDRVEVLREPNSVLYGSDALTGVISLTTRRGRTRIPDLKVSLDAGNFGTSRQEIAVGGVVRRFDYFSDFSHFDTDNEAANNHFRNDTYAGRFGVALGRATDVSGTVRLMSTKYGVPNAVESYGIADDSRQTTDQAFVSVNADSQLTDRWSTTVRFGWMDRDYYNVNPTPTGTPVGGNYLGNLVTITGGNGYSATGRAILDFGGAYPSPFESGATRKTLLGQTTLHVSPALDVSAGARFESEEGFSYFTARTGTDRTNGGAFVEGRARFARMYVNGGLGVEQNEIFGTAVTPRVSMAVYLRTPSATGRFGDTKVIFNAGTGIKAPNISQELSSLDAILTTSGSILDVDPIGAERSRSVDVGVEQGIWGGRARVRATFFDNDFDDLIEFVNKTVLPEVGVPADIVAALPGGAYVNSQSIRAKGLETSADVRVTSDLRVSASYTYLDAVVRESFASSALRPATNPAFPGILIGSSALVGGRPFRRPTNSAGLLVAYSRGPIGAAVAGSFVGKTDDTTFLLDEFFGNSMLLPNKDLHAAYQKIDLSGSYQFHRSIRWYVSVENLLDQHYDVAFGFPALSRAVRSGVTVSFGGDRLP
jgi:vitamin B12 transporter